MTFFFSTKNLVEEKIGVLDQKESCWFQLSPSPNCKRAPFRASAYFILRAAELDQPGYRVVALNIFSHSQWVVDPIERR